MYDIITISDVMYAKELEIKFLDEKFNQLNNKFNNVRNNDFYLERFNSINELNEHNQTNVIATLLSDNKYQFSNMILTRILKTIPEDLCCNYLGSTLERNWEEYTSNLKLQIEIEIVLINYKNGVIDSKTAYKKYNEIKDQILKNKIKFMNEFKEFDEILYLANDKDRILNLTSKLLNILEIDSSSLKNSKDVIDLLFSYKFEDLISEKSDSLKYYIYNSEELKCAMIQLEKNINELNLSSKNKKGF